MGGGLKFNLCDGGPLYDYLGSSTNYVELDFAFLDLSNKKQNRNPYFKGTFHDTASILK